MQKSILARTFHNLSETQKLGKKNDLPLHSSAIAFLSLFAFCPLFILIFLVSQYLLGESGKLDSAKELKDFIETIMPVAENLITKNMGTVLRNSLFGGLVSVSLLVWSALELFFGLQVVFIKLSHVKESKTPFLQNFSAVVCFLVVLIAGSAFLTLSLIPKPVLLQICGLSPQDISPNQLTWILSAVSFLLILGGIALIYKLMPNQTVHPFSAISGAFLFMVFFAGGKLTYLFYLRFYRSLNENVYGPFFTIIEILIWFYFLSHIFLFCAQYTLYLEAKRAQKPL